MMIPADRELVLYQRAADDDRSPEDVDRDLHDLAHSPLSDSVRLYLREIGKVAKAARERTCTPDKLTGSTFTISNFGSLAGRFGTPIINYPEAGILGIGRAHEGVIVNDGMLGVGKLLPLSLSADHRVIDGATAAGALGKIMELLGTPEDLLPEPEARCPPHAAGFPRCSSSNSWEFGAHTAASVHCSNAHLLDQSHR